MSNLSKTRILVFLFSLILFLSIINPLGIPNSRSADASLSLGQTIQQFQNNLQETINEEFQSLLEGNNNSNSRCDSNNNISIQSQTNNNSKTTSTIWNLCDNSNFFSSFSSISENVNLNGKIVSSDYNISAATIVNSIFGNWSLTTKDKGSIDFNASFIKQPIYYNTSVIPFAGNNSLDSSSSSTNLNNIDSNVKNTTTYHLANFVVNSIQQHNEDITYSGKIDVAQEIISTDTTSTPIESTSYEDVNISISILNSLTLTIHFDDSSKLFEEFKNIPLVGIVQ